MTSGKGKPLVFFHGFIENSTMWDDIIPYFSDRYMCITIDLLGHGKTACLGYIHTMEDMAMATKAVSDALKLKDIILIGHSMGGYVALAYIDLFPKAVSALVLVNSTSFPDSEERKINRGRAINLVKRNPDIYTSMAIANLFAEKNRSQFKTEIESIKKEASKTSLQGIISALEGMKVRKDRSELLQKFKGSKIIFAGKKDPVLSCQQTMAEAKLCETKLRVFDGGHMSYLENHNEFLKFLDQFLSFK
ncbi:alpha/beta fold hydrolase [Aquimarina sp. RZ0]|uniref:alpha/beta fold hydrolase n=1 Tax=Aquimarina sp. RZ0 TaxID=2607730 RepID=UPI00210553B5|nr:alpha/beta fold hydrolase [Aquimarina sp. RZ0]